jgi:hypothetical protein
MNVKPLEDQNNHVLMCYGQYQYHKITIMHEWGADFKYKIGFLEKKKMQNGIVMSTYQCIMQTCYATSLSVFCVVIVVKYILHWGEVWPTEGTVLSTV